MISDELFGIADNLDSLRTEFKSSEVQSPLQRLEDASTRAGNAFSGSWLGYHSCVYYKGFEPPPAGARFSQEWGFIQADWFNVTTGHWVEYSFEDARRAIYELAGNPDIKPAKELAERAGGIIEDKRAEIVSLITTALGEGDDQFLVRLKEEAEEAKVFYANEFVDHYRPTGKFITKDTIVAGQGFRTPPHIAVLAEVQVIQSTTKVCERLSKVARRAASHLMKRDRYARRKQEIGTNVFIGHGRSSLWRDLKDFLQDRLGLPWDEFNRVPVAGIINIARLSQMLDDAAIAFLVMTAEDEQADGKLRARMNVVHEAGLFQGKLGFTKAIVLLEEGCEEFSNIHGLGQIRFPKGDIRTAFEEIRQVLEREGVLNS